MGCLCVCVKPPVPLRNSSRSGCPCRRATCVQLACNLRATCVQLACNLRATCVQLAYGQALEDAQAVIPVPAKILLLP